MMTKPRFSIITPVYIHSEERKQMFWRSLSSVDQQYFGDFEHIVVEDGSKIKWMGDVPETPYRRIIEQKHQERYIAYNNGLKEAKGEWICFLDSDDAYSPYYLQAVDEMIKQYPEYKMFNFGSIHFHQNFKVSTRPVFYPKVEKVGHEVFKSGTIVNGTYVFHRSVFEDLGGIPHVTNPWDFSKEYCEQHPEIRKYYEYIKENGKKVLREVGNPYGQDWAYFYKFTRKYHSKPIEAYLYYVYSKHGYKLEKE